MGVITRNGSGNELVRKKRVFFTESGVSRNMKIVVGRAMGNRNPDRLTENGGSRIGILERLVRGSSVVSSLDEHTTRSHFPFRIVARIVHHRCRREIGVVVEKVIKPLRARN